MGFVRQHNVPAHDGVALIGCVAVLGALTLGRLSLRRLRQQLQGLVVVDHQDTQVVDAGCLQRVAPVLDNGLRAQDQHLSRVGSGEAFEASNL